MKIWYLVDEFPPSFGGGIGMYVDIVSRMMAQTGNHSVTVLTADQKNENVKITPFLRHVRFSRPTGNEYPQGYYFCLYRKYFEQTMRLIDQQGSPDVIEITDFPAIGYYILNAKMLGDSRLADTKIVVHCHTPSFEINPINRTPSYRFPEYWIGEMEKYCLRTADALVTQSEFLRSHLLPYTNGKDIKVIPLPYHFKSKDEIGTIGDHLLYTGRLEYRKGIWDFLPHMVKCWEEGSKVSLVLLGGDVFFSPKESKMGDLIRQKYQKWIDCGLLKLMNKVPPDELERLMREARAVVIPSLYENYPYTNVIAMANHCPVLVSLQGGQAEAVGSHGVNGFIFDWNKPNDCYNVLKELLSTSKETLRTIGNNAYKRIYECCNPEDNLANRISFYTQVLNEKRTQTTYPFANQVERTPLPQKVQESTEILGMLSVVIPYYNLGETVEETILSLLQSDYPSKEIILLDDGSTDDRSRKKAELMKTKYPSIQLVRIQNGGLANARNVGVTLAKGEYLCFVDADDTVEPSYFTKCINLLKRYTNVSFVYSWLQYFGASQDIWVTYDTEFPYFCTQNQLAAMAVVRRKDYLAFGFNHPDMEYGLEDYDSWLGLAENGYLGICIPELLCNYRVRPNSMARSMSREALIYLRTRLSEHHPKLYKVYGDEVYKLLLQNGSNLYWGTPLATPSSSTSSSSTSYADSQGLMSEIISLKQQIETMKNRRGYRLVDKCANVAYRSKFIRFIRFRFLPRLKRLIRRE